MPKKITPRAQRSPSPGTADSRSRRTVRSVPRPSASVPIGTVGSPGTYREAAAAAPASAPRTYTTSGRLYRPARASTLPLIVDYGYVASDLKRVALLAGVAFAVLIGLTFVVH